MLENRNDNFNHVIILKKILIMIFKFPNVKKEITIYRVEIVKAKFRNIGCESSSPFCTYHFLTNIWSGSQEKLAGLVRGRGRAEHFRPADRTGQKTGRNFIQN